MEESPGTDKVSRLTITLRYFGEVNRGVENGRATFCPIRGDVWHLTKRATVNGRANGTYLNYS